MGSWRFADALNLSVFTVRQTVHGGRAVLFVSHDVDGSWQFLPGGNVSEADAMTVSLYSMISRDPSLMELADLPLGRQAYRRSVDSAWIRERRGP
jgi:hypothetical protein